MNDVILLGIVFFGGGRGAGMINTGPVFFSLIASHLLVLCTRSICILNQQDMHNTTHTLVAKLLLGILLPESLHQLVEVSSCLVERVTIHTAHDSSILTTTGTTVCSSTRCARFHNPNNERRVRPTMFISHLESYMARIIILCI
ncbi:hypothetical protein C8R41DRAFT_32269 [Lentinula lateritia]|uniref:Secreted protein n=1 Tax=Lentinula lateritia TaxID=40482 RepID=A0ABQ8VTD6_9AGAR|nr:hypothetical protein C8R41DRAFT_32269 [Lentinula lateritia]